MFADAFDQFTAAVLGIVGSLTVILPVLAAFVLSVQKKWKELLATNTRQDQECRELRENYKTVWSGILKRGFVEARNAKHIFRKGIGLFECSDDARQAYGAISNALKQIFVNLTGILSRPPTDDELAWAIEKVFQDFMVSDICPNLNVSQHGCLAIACVIAREPFKYEEGRPRKDCKPEGPSPA